MSNYVRLLTIAGSDSGGGAGIQADLKTFSACGCFGMSAITAITAQNTLGVTDIHPVPVSTIQEQVRAVARDIGVDAVKIGMLHSTEVIHGVAEVLSEVSTDSVVLDPVMVATSGDRLIREDAVDALKEVLFPGVTLITPNIPEAEILLGREITKQRDLLAAARELTEKFGLSVLLKAGHLSEARLEDILVLSTGEVHSFTNERLDTENTHGTGCTLSSAVASWLGHGYELPEAVRRAESYLHGAIVSGAGYRLGSGHGPVNHFFHLWKSA